MESNSQRDVGMTPVATKQNKSTNEKVLSGNPPKHLFTLRRVCRSLKIWMTQQQDDRRNSFMENTIAVGVRDNSGLSLWAEERNQMGSLERQGRSRAVSASPPYLEMPSRTTEVGVLRQPEEALPL